MEDLQRLLREQAWVGVQHCGLRKAMYLQLVLH
jgi:hypothetical protein